MTLSVSFTTSLFTPTVLAHDGDGGGSFGCGGGGGCGGGCGGADTCTDCEVLVL